MAHTENEVLVVPLKRGNKKSYRIINVLGNQYGDEGKGKLVPIAILGCPADRAKRRVAKCCVRYNGGPNAGHTVIVVDHDLDMGPEYVCIGKEIKFATQQLPTGILFKNVHCAIGHGCVIDFAKLEKEIRKVAAILHQTPEYLASKLTISSKAHVILPRHLAQDSSAPSAAIGDAKTAAAIGDLANMNQLVGTTGSGIGPCYADKCNRTGLRTGEILICKTHQTDLVAKNLAELVLSEFFTPEGISDCGNRGMLGYCVVDSLVKWFDMHTLDGDIIVFEGAQAKRLDINWGDYPFVTSSDCTIAATCNYGLDMSDYVTIGCSKLYITYVGSMQFEPGFSQHIKHSGKYELLRLLGHENGVNTGRRRQCNILDMDEELNAIKINRVRTYVINKGDVLERFHHMIMQYKIDRTFGDLSDLDEETRTSVEEYLAHINELPTPMEFPVKGLQYIYKKEVYSFDTLIAMRRMIVNIIQIEPHAQSVVRISFYDNPSSSAKFTTPMFDYAASPQAN